MLAVQYRHLNILRPLSETSHTTELHCTGGGRGGGHDSRVLAVQYRHLNMLWPQSETHHILLSCTVRRDSRVLAVQYRHLHMLWPQSETQHILLSYTVRGGGGVIVVCWLFSTVISICSGLSLKHNTYY